MNDQTEQVQAKDELRRHRDHLEEQVAERTAELQAEIAERAQVEEALRQRNRELALLNRAGQAFSSTLDGGQVLAAVLEEARCLLGVTACSIWLIDPETGELVCRQVTNPQRDVVRGWRLRAGQGIAGWVALHGASLIVPDVRSDVRHFKEVDRQTGLQVRSILCVPLKVKEIVTGVLQVVDEQVGRFGDEDLELLESLAAPAAIAIENARLYDLAQQEISDRKRAEAALYRSEERAHSVVQHLSDIVWVIDEDARLAYETPSCSAILGYGPGYMLGKSGLDFVHPDDVARVGHELDGVFSKQRQLACTAFRARHADGHWVQLEAIASNQLDQPGIQGVIMTCRNITKRARAEQLLQTLNQVALAMATALTPDEICTAVGQEFRRLGFSSMVFPVDESKSKLVVKYVNYDARALRAAEKLTGFRRKGFAFAIDDIETYRKIVRERQTVLIQNTVEAMREVIPGPVKGLAEQLVRILKMTSAIAAPLIAEDEVIGVLSVQSDDLTRDDVPAITAFAHQVAAAWHRAQLYERAQQEIAERARAERELRESEERFRNVFENAPIGIYRTTPDGRILMANPALVRMLGYASFEELARLNLEQENRHPACWRSEFRQRVEGEGQVSGFEAEWPTRDGGSVQIRENAKVVRDAGGNVLYYDGTVEDITERKRLEAQFLQSQKMEAVGHLAGGVAHDFNNLLTVIEGYADFMLRRLDIQVPIDRATRQALCADLAGIQQTVGRAAALTNQLLIFSRKQAPQPRMLDLDELVRNVEKMLRRLIGEDINLTTSLASKLGRVKADPGHIEQVIVNLVVNARDAMPQGGQITLRTANVELDRAYVREHPGARPGSCVMLAVSDTGIGMSEEVKAHLFEPFFTTKQAGKGTGLGLATVYRIVEQSSGHIEVYSQVEVGTTFRVYLPRIEVAAELTEPEALPQVLPTGTETILLVEDEKDVRELIGRVLARQGYEVLVAGHPDEALLLCARHVGPIQLLVTDVVMPGMNGCELAKWMMSRRPETAVLYISGYIDDSIARCDPRDQGVAFLPKPFTSAALARKVREVLDGT